MAKNSNKKNSDILVPLLGFSFLILVFAAPVGPDLNDHMLVKASALEAYVWTIAVLFLFKFNDGNLHFVKEAIPIVLGLFIGWGILSLFWSANAHYGIVLLLKWLTGALLAILAFQIKTYVNITRLLQYLFAACVFISLMGIFQHLFGLDLIYQTKPPAATFANRNMAGQIIVLSWLPGVYFLLQSTKKDSFAQYYYAIGVVLAITYAIYIGSRAVWISIFIQMLLLAAFLIAGKFQKVRTVKPECLNKKALASAIIFFLLLINFDSGGFKPVWSTLADRITDTQEEASRVEGPGAFKRFLLWNSTLEMIKDKPLLGAGMGGFEATHQQFAYGDTVYSAKAHNDYLQTTSELGVIAPILILVLGLLLLRKSWLLLSNTGDTHSLARYMLLVILAGMAVDAFFSFPLQLLGPIIIVSILLGLFFRLNYLQAEADSKIQLGPTLQMAVASILVPLTLLIFWLNIEWSMRLQELSDFVKAERTRQTLNLETTIEHPTFKQFVWILTNQYRSTKPRKAEKIAKAYEVVNDQDVIVANTLALTAILQKNYEQGRAYLKKARALEADGNYSSWVSELVMYGQLNDKQGLRRVLDLMETKPRKELMAQQYTMVAMASTAYQLGDPEHAASLLKENISVHPFYSPSHERLVQILVKLNRRDEAREYLQHLKSIVGENNVVMALEQIIRR